MFKTIKELQIEQYGKEITWLSYNIINEVKYGDFWLYFNINYKECYTIDLLSLLQTLRVFELDVNDIEKYYSVFNAIKNELSTREHIPNKKERKQIRKDKAKLKW